MINRKVRVTNDQMPTQKNKDMIPKRLPQWPSLMNEPSFGEVFACGIETYIPFLYLLATQIIPICLIWQINKVGGDERFKKKAHNIVKL